MAIHRSIEGNDTADIWTLHTMGKLLAQYVAGCHFYAPGPAPQAILCQDSTSLPCWLHKHKHRHPLAPLCLQSKQSVMGECVSLLFACSSLCSLMFTSAEQWTGLGKSSTGGLNLCVCVWAGTFPVKYYTYNKVGKDTSRQTINPLYHTPTPSQTAVTLRFLRNVFCRSVDSVSLT